MSELNTTRSAITLQGSSKMIQEFFKYGINSILFQRGIYPDDMFSSVKRYGMNLLVTNDQKLLDFLSPLLAQIEDLLVQKRLKQLVIVIMNVATKEVLERWQFEVKVDSRVGENTKVDACDKRIKHEISDVIRQITAAVSFLPLLEDECTFDVLMYTSKVAKLGNDWSDTTARNIKNPEEVQLRSFSAKALNVRTKVQYKADL